MCLNCPPAPDPQPIIPVPPCTGEPCDSTEQDKCIEVTRDLPNIGVEAGERLDSVLDKLDDFVNPGMVDSDTITWTSNDPYSATLNINPDPSNKIEVTSDGVYVPPLSQDEAVMLMDLIMLDPVMYDRFRLMVNSVSTPPECTFSCALEAVDQDNGIFLVTLMEQQDENMAFDVMAYNCATDMYEVVQSYVDVETLTQGVEVDLGSLDPDLRFSASIRVVAIGCSSFQDLDTTLACVDPGVSTTTSTTSTSTSTSTTTTAPGGSTTSSTTSTTSTTTAAPGGTTTTSTSTTSTTSTSTSTTSTTSTTSSTTTSQPTSFLRTMTFTYAGTNTWNIHVKLPDTYYTDSLSTTYPIIIFYPGSGQLGTDASLLNADSTPYYYINNGSWNGQITTDSTIHKPIIITVQSPNQWASTGLVQASYTAVKALGYRYDSSRIHMVGYSAGGWMLHGMVLNNATMCREWNTMITIGAVKPDDWSTPPWAAYGTNLTKTRYIAFEQTADISRDASTIVNTVNTANPRTPATALYFNTTFGDGSHACCTYQFINPALKAYPDLDGRDETIYQWMMRQTKYP